MNAGALTADGRAVQLRDGNQLPMLGLGVWQVPEGPVCVNAVRWALELGYRHIDTAQAYGNEASVGKALRESGVPRNEVFITTKFYPGHQDPVIEAEASLRRLGVDQVDLYLVHWPQGGPLRAWPGMEQARVRGLAKSIGVSNFGADDLGKVIAAARMQPHMISTWVRPRDGLRRQMNRFSRNMPTNRTTKCVRLSQKWPFLRKDCQPRHQYRPVGGRWSHME